MSATGFRHTFFIITFFLAYWSSESAGREILLPDTLTANPSAVVIGKITIIGNKITKPHIILRELSLKAGDTVSVEDFDARRIRSEENLYNTSLFNSAKITHLAKEDGTTDLYIIVKERWYIFPLPVFEVVDRNFNVWWRTKDFSRIVYGGVLSWNNFRGRNETVALAIRLGYIQQVGFSYTVPFIDKKQKSGLSLGFAYARNHQTAYRTAYDDVVYYKDTTKYARQLYSGVLEYVYRKGLYTKHFLTAGYTSVTVEDTVLSLNPEYLAKGKSKSGFTTLRYLYRNDHRDYVYYPLRGYVYNIELVKTGVAFLGDAVDYTYVTAELKKFWEVTRRFYFGASFRGKLSDGNFQPYFNTRALGYGRDYVRGYEYYVIDGQHFILMKSNLKFSLLPKKELHAGFIPLEKFATIPFSFYLNAYADAAYVEDTQFANVLGNSNQLPNSWLFGYGIGVDFVSYYDIVIRLDYSVNKFGESGLFLHFAAPI